MLLCGIWPKFPHVKIQCMLKHFFSLVFHFLLEACVAPSSSSPSFTLVNILADWVYWFLQNQYQIHDKNREWKIEPWSVHAHKHKIKIWLLSPTKFDWRLLHKLSSCFWTTLICMFYEIIAKSEHWLWISLQNPCNKMKCGQVQKRRIAEQFTQMSWNEKCEIEFRVSFFLALLWTYLWAIFAREPPNFAVLKGSMSQ